MKIVENISRNQTNRNIEVDFTIYGERKKGSLEIPLYTNSFVVTCAELSTAQFDIFKELKRKNALAVFERYYQDTFLLNKI